MVHTDPKLEKMSESNKRRLVNPLLPFVFKKGHHFPEDIELRRIKNVMKGLRKRPTLLEHDMLRIIQKHNLPFRYVGDGEIWLGHSNPDFIHIDKGKKICLEVSNTFNRNYESYAKPRIEKLQLVGWRCLVFFGEKNQLNEDDILCSLRAIGV